MIYLASAYSNLNPQVVEDRMTAFFDVDIYLASNGMMTVSPLYKTLAAAKNPDMDLSFSYWETYCELLLNMCDSMIIVTSVGWNESIGVKCEIEIARQSHKPIKLIDPKTFKITDLE